jgi:hypothetical protein
VDCDDGVQASGRVVKETDLFVLVEFDALENAGTGAGSGVQGTRFHPASVTADAVFAYDPNGSCAHAGIAPPEETG